MENYEKLKQVIQQANPEIMELKFGCEIDVAGIKRQIYHTNDKGIWTLVNDMSFLNSKEQIELNRNIKILGRPIRLADVMIAIEKNTKPPATYMLSTNGTITFRESKQITAQVFNNRFLSTGMSWNLYNDNLDHQSDETKQFLIDLLITS